MSEILVNFHLPFLVIALAIGYQISVYYFYLYFKFKKEKIGLNKVLLAHGLIYGFLFTSIAIRTLYTYFLVDSLMKNIAFQLSHIFAILAAFSFLIIKISPTQ